MAGKLAKLKKNSLKKGRNTTQAPASCGKRSGPKYVVGVGASAGGLEALRALFGSVVDPNDMAFLVVQHLAPLYKSRLVELIAHSTTLKVAEARDRESPRAGTVYVTPPNKDIVIQDGRFRLSRPHLKIGPKPSIDRFFQSLAEDRGECCIAIVLSGTGTDGSHGIRAIKAGGGLTISQKIGSAKYDGMPKAAQLTGAVDLELTPEQMAKELAKYKGLRKSIAEQRQRPFDDKNPYGAILQLLHDQSGTDFQKYKPATVQRRIERRMAATHSASLEKYHEYLSTNLGEVKLLFQDILISVTCFFRDPEAFKVLEKRLTEQLRKKRSGSNIRCWSIGCATGEESYSLAMLIMEIGLRLQKPFNVQVFATDLDEVALGVARRGIYSKASVSDLPSDFLERYFTVVEGRFQVIPAVRDAVVFAKHDINQDPPFLSMDLVSCRNILIYFGQELQESVFKTAHYALNSDGLLFLGKSESVSAAPGYFHLDHKAAKIFSRVDRKSILPRQSSIKAKSTPVERADAAPPPPAGSDLFASMIANFAPDSLVLNENNEIEFIHGKAGAFLTFHSGGATHEIMKLLPPEMALELSTLIHRARRDGRLVKGRDHPVVGAASPEVVSMRVGPLRGDGKLRTIVTFDRAAQPGAGPMVEAIAAGSEDPGSLAVRLRKTELDLAATQSHLQTITEEQETNNEELQSLNEELQSANEELQSTNEELETANEEMQSTNEELTTLNEELNVKSAELIMSNQTLYAVQNSMIYPLLVVDKGLRLLSFNPAARYLLRISENDIGHTLKSIPMHLGLGKVIASVEKTIRAGTEATLQISEHERFFEVQLQLFRGVKDAVEGAVISFVDNTEIITALEAAKTIKGRLTDIMDNTPAKVTMKDTMGVYTYANRRFAQLVGEEVEDVLGQTDDELIGAEQSRHLRERDFEVAKLRGPIQSEEKIAVGGKQYWWASARFPILDAKNRVQSVCTISLDITERINHRRQLELFKQAVSSATGGIMLLEHSAEDDFRTTFVSEELGDAIRVESKALIGRSLREVLKRLVSKMTSQKSVKKNRGRTFRGHQDQDLARGHARAIGVPGGRALARAS